MSAVISYGEASFRIVVEYLGSLPRWQRVCSTCEGFWMRRIIALVMAKGGGGISCAILPVVMAI